MVFLAVKIMAKNAGQNRADLLVEIGTEELPPAALKTLAIAFQDQLVAGLSAAGLVETPRTSWFATPRRLAVRVSDVAKKGEAQSIERRGPALAAAYDKNGQPTKAALGFARSCGISIDEAEILKTEKGEWLIHRSVTPGAPAKDIIGSSIQSSVDKLPIPKRMRWGSGEAEFVRPVHWLVVLHGSTIVPCSVLNTKAGRKTRGHRFMSGDATISIDNAGAYEETLLKDGAVIADFEKRANMIEREITKLGKKIGGRAVIDGALLETVTALVEQPRGILGQFDPDYLNVPAEALISSMRDHQKYFHVVNERGELLPAFITISNIHSTSPARVKAGNERVLNARLADARFFWDSDASASLESHVASLENVLFHHALGSLADKTRRLEVIATQIAAKISVDATPCARAARLCKADLLTGMVGEFPEMQGTMGRYLARHDKEAMEVCAAIEEHYWPRHAGDELPQSPVGAVLAIADRMDSLLGLFIAAEEPTGEKDPYALRRAALGVIRILVEKKLDLDITALVDVAADAYAAQGRMATPEVREQCRAFILDRYRALYASLGFAPDEISAVLEAGASHPLDFDRRIKAVAQFRKNPDALSLAAANKRVRNILKKNASGQTVEVDPALLSESAEIALSQALAESAAAVAPAMSGGDFEKALQILSQLRPTVDRFFDEVMVMAEDSAVKNNRIALLHHMNELFLGVADISLLQSPDT